MEEVAGRGAPPSQPQRSMEATLLVAPLDETIKNVAAHRFRRELHDTEQPRDSCDNTTLPGDIDMKTGTTRSGLRSPTMAPGPHATDATNESETSFAHATAEATDAASGTTLQGACDMKRGIYNDERCRSARHAPTPRHMAALAPPAVADAPCSPTHPRALPQPRHVPRLPTPHFAPRALTRSPLVYAADGGRQAACGVWGAVGSVCRRAGGQASRLGGKWLQRDC